MSAIEFACVITFLVLNHLQEICYMKNWLRFIISIAHIVLVEQVPQARLHIMLMVPMLAVGAYSLQYPRDAYSLHSSE